MSSYREINHLERLFKKGSALSVRLVVFLILAVLLLNLDHRSKLFHRWRQNASIVVYPIQLIVDAPVRLINWVRVSVMSRQMLRSENAQLRAEQLLLRSRLQRLRALQHENSQLRELLKSSSKVTGKVSVARLLAVDMNPYRQQIVLNRGRRQHVFVGQPVLDAYGVMGQVINVGLETSDVMLISDRHSAIPVMDFRTGLRAIALGMGSGDRLTLIDVPETNDIKQGDLFVASGLGLRYPVGYPVGRVTQIIHFPGRRVVQILLKPTAHLDRTQQVLLAWPNRAKLRQAVDQELAHNDTT